MKNYLDVTMFGNQDMWLKIYGDRVWEWITDNQGMDKPFRITNLYSKWLQDSDMRDISKNERQIKSKLSCVLRNVEAEYIKNPICEGEECPVKRISHQHWILPCNTLVY